ncbi:MAG TPA: HypC/HybG/HupF family hydrogenase formation chaperone [Candidatus Moranbacteria bacterium]|nr:HypC/HybG/HupF family hydrogenase formation chaperone [Candidatus Moranbacteria bacterium]
MCLTIPKKVISIEKGGVIVENPAGDRQTVKSIVELNIGDFCLTQQNVAIEKMDEEDAGKIINEIIAIRKEEKYNGNN